MKIDLIKGECLEVMKSIPDASIDAIITDPPYGTTACKWDNVIPFDLMWEQLNRIIKPNGAIVLFGSEPFSSALRMSNIKNYKYDWVWNKKVASNSQLCKYQPLKITELVHIFSKKTHNYYPQGLKDCDIIKSNKNRSKGVGHIGSEKLRDTFKQTKTGYPKNIIEFKPNNINKQHPTQKPVALMEYLIKTYTNENETILDFTMGSGSTGVACVNTKRNFIGIELDDKYYNIAKQRIGQAQLKLF
jgi:site-specific DNA-methyltransferase (adenine-specific)